MPTDLFAQAGIDMPKSSQKGQGVDLFKKYNIAPPDDGTFSSFSKSRRDNLNKIFESNKANPDMQGGANAPALVKARQDVSKKTSQNENEDVPVAIGNAAYNATWPVSAIAKKAIGQGDTPRPQATTGGGKAVEDVAGAMANPILQGGLNLAGKAIKSVAKFIPDTIKRGAADYLTNDVAPKVHQMFQDAVAKFTPEIENFARKLKVPESAIASMKKYGTQAVEQAKDSQDAISQRINQGLAAKDKEVSEAYAKAFTGKDNVNISIPNSANAMKALLRKANYIDDKGNVTEYAKNDITEDSALRKILNFYQSSKPSKIPASSILDASGKPIPSDPSTKDFDINGFQWRTFRDDLSKLRRSNKGLSPEITKIQDSLHSDAESAGFKGIGQARVLAKRNFEAEDKFTNNQNNVMSLFKEKGIGKYHTMSGEQKRSVQELGNYIGDKNLTSDVEKASAGQYLDKIMGGKDLEGFRTILNQASDRKWTIARKIDLEQILGKQNAQKIIDEVIANRKAGLVKKAGYVGGLAATATAGAAGKKALNFFTGQN